MSATRWSPVGRAGDVPLLEGRSVAFAGTRVAIFRLPDGWAAVEQRCPHRGGPLADGLVADACVTCPLHGWRFDVRTGEQQGGDARVATFDVREVDGRLELRVPVAQAEPDEALEAAA
jgi:nitrite reductase (NADH) small subunit